MSPAGARTESQVGDVFAAFARGADSTLPSHTVLAVAL
jgi:hypothetical protein